ncbi:thiamine transporter 1-like [Sabethes cyaneus]|uniref:thiamine transporter 1-like n=1 Tax=Sabethes cyaneus TaxID=53552 RepID=UPI00237E4126|nr:thiamine transporter 1-like [Sabethes cyaneus]
MEKWCVLAIVLSVFGFIKDFKPSDPFIVQFLNGPWHNISTDVINRDIFPVGTYSYGVQLVLTFLVTDYLRYKPLIVLSALAGILHWSLFIWTNEIKWLQLSEVFYGTYKAADIAFWSYIYARVEKSHYQRITCCTKSASFFGKFAAAIGSQALLFFGVVTFLDLNYASLAVQICTASIALCLPPAPESIYFRKKQPSGDVINGKTDPKTNIVPTIPAVSHNLTVPELLWMHVKTAYSNFTILRYSIWHALSSCIYYQTQLYSQVLWNTIDAPVTIGVYWNGAVDALLTISAAVIIFLAGFIPAKALQTHCTLAGLGWISFAQAGALLGVSCTRNLWVAYGGHILYSVLHSLAVTLLSAEIARNISSDSFGLVLGINAAISSMLQILVTVVVVDGAGLIHGSINVQFAIYSCWCAMIGILFWVFFLVELGQWWKRPLLLLRNRVLFNMKQSKADDNGNVDVA